MTGKPQDETRRFFAKVHKQPGGCWVWTAAKGHHGYGRFWSSSRGRTVQAHRWSYEEATGATVPFGRELDHLCRNPGCVNPDHLEPVTHRENLLRGTGVVAQCARRTHCVNGHEYNEENTYVRPNGGRACKECNRRTSQKYRDKKKEA